VCRYSEKDFATARVSLLLMHIGMDRRGECGKSPRERRTPTSAAASLVTGDRPAAATAGNTDLRTGWTRFQKTADYNTIANRVPLAAMIRWPRLKRSLVIAVVPICKGWQMPPAGSATQDTCIVGTLATTASEPITPHDGQRKNSFVAVRNPRGGSRKGRLFRSHGSWACDLVRSGGFSSIS
jgi:hypothetical protein